MSSETEKLFDFDKLWNYNLPEVTEKKFLEILPIAKISSDKGYYLELMTQIARTQGLQMKFDKAHETLNNVEKMLTTDLETAKIRYLLERGRVYNSSGDKEKAKEYFSNAWDLAIKTKQDYYGVDVAHMLAIVETGDKQLEWNLNALELAEKSDDERAKKWHGSLYNNIGWTYFDKVNYEKALEYFKKGVEFHEKKQNSEGYSIAKWTVGRTTRALKKPEEALQIQKNLLSERKEMGLDNDGYVHEEIAECLFELDKKDEAKEHFAKAYELLSGDIWLQKNEKPRLERLQNLSK